MTNAIKSRARYQALDVFPSDRKPQRSSEHPATGVRLDSPEVIGRVVYFDVLDVVANAGWMPQSALAISELESLDENWDGEDAPAPSAPVIEAARVTLDMLAAIDLEPERIEASTEGGVSFYFFSARRDAREHLRPRFGVLSFYNSGEASRLLSDRATSQVDAREIRIEATAIGASISEISAFISED